MGDSPTYDPTWLVNLVRLEFPEEVALAVALADCTAPLSAGPAYVRFVDVANPNAPGSDWQFDRNVVLDSSPQGMVVIDLLKDGRVGGIEFPDHVRS